MTLSIIHGQLADATLRSIALDTADRWYLDTICRRNLTHTTPKVGGSFALTGADVTIYLISTGVCDSPCFYGRLSWLLGDVGVDVVGTGTNMAFLLGASHYGVAPRCIIKSLNVYTAKGILDPAKYQQAVDFILQDQSSKTSIVLSSAIQSPNYGDMVIRDDLDQDTQRLLDAGLVVVVPAGDGFVDNLTGELYGPLLADVVHPACMDEVITVGSYGADFTLPLFTNYGYFVDAFAPGVEIPVLDREGQWVITSGTHCSAAIVAGILSHYLEKFSRHIRSQVRSFIQEHFFHHGLMVSYPLERLQKDVFFNDTLQYLVLHTAAGYPFQYLVDTQVPYTVAHAFFTRSVLEVGVTSLGPVLANTELQIPLGVVFRNAYNECKPLIFKLKSFSPSDSHRFEVGRTTGILFGIVGDVESTVTIHLVVEISDGINLINQSFSLTVLQNQVDKDVVGGVIRARLQNVRVLDVKELPNTLNVNSLPPAAKDVSVAIDRDVRLLNTVTGEFIGKVITTKSSGEFLFTVPKGIYQAVVLDARNEYTAFTIDGLR